MQPSSGGGDGLLSEFQTQKKIIIIDIPRSARMAAAVHRNDRSFAFEWNLAIVQYEERAESELVPLRVCVCVTFF